MTVITISRHLRTALRIAGFASRVRLIGEPMQRHIRKAVLITRRGVKYVEKVSGNTGEKAQSVVSTVVTAAVDVVRAVTTAVTTVRSALGLLRMIFAA